MTSHKILFLVSHHPDYSNLEHASLSTLLLCVLYLCCVCLVAQQVRTLCHPMDCRLPGSSCQLNSLEWVAMPSSRRSSHPRDQIQVSRNAGRFFTVWATREAHEYWRSPFARGSSRPRNWTVVSGIAGRFFTSWATREAPIYSFI